jgi:hypothetical protein
MMENLKRLFNPFERIAGWTALLWGSGGIVLATILSYYTQFHCHGLLHYGLAPNNTFLCFVVEHLVIWIAPAVLFYVGGLIFSTSKIRAVDVFGTTAFASLPLIFMILFFMLPPLQKMNELLSQTNLPLLQLVKQFDFLAGILLATFGLIFVIWMLIWFFHALRVSCNLKAYKLVTVFCIGIFGGDIITRLIIGMFY